VLDGEMGRWGDGEMGRWGDGEMGEQRTKDKSVISITFTIKFCHDFYQLLSLFNSIENC
jgi:hypothetical protein